MLCVVDAVGPRGAAEGHSSVIRRGLVRHALTSHVVVETGGCSGIPGGRAEYQGPQRRQWRARIRAEARRSPLPCPTQPRIQPSSGAARCSESRGEEFWYNTRSCSPTLSVSKSQTECDTSKQGRRGDRDRTRGLGCSLPVQPSEMVAEAFDVKSGL